MLAAAQDSGVRNLVVITGDRHQNYALELKRDFADPNSRTVGTEFVGTSITSGGDGADTTDQGRQFLAANPHLKFFTPSAGTSRSPSTSTSGAPTSASSRSSARRTPRSPPARRTSSRTGARTSTRPDPRPAERIQ
jgi:phosphodiesterase/alkaline phosphatase D-like protein